MDHDKYKAEIEARFVKMAQINQRANKLRLINLRHAAFLLRDYLENNNCGGTGKFILECLERAPRVHPGYQSLYYDNVGAIYQMLQRYSEFTLRSSFSPRYEADMTKQMFAIQGWLTEIESDSKWPGYLRMLWTKTPPEGEEE